MIKTKKIISLLVSICLILVAFNSLVFANNLESEYIEVMGTGHGSYVIQQNSIKIFDNSKLTKIKKLKGDIYEDIVTQKNKKPQKFLKVNDNTFQAVDEVSFHASNEYDIERVIHNFEISPELADDLLSFSKREDITNKEVTLYLPSKLFNESSSNFMIQGSLGYSYYTGYNGEQYRDEIFEAHGSTSMEIVKSGTSVKTWIDKNLANFGSLIAGTNKYIGVAYTLASILFDIPTNATPHSTDKWNAAMAEQKYRKYTALYYNYSGYPNGGKTWKVRAISDSGDVQIHHYVYFYQPHFSRTYTDPNKYYYLDNYYNLDQKAYEVRYDYSYFQETVTRWNIRDNSSGTVLKFFNSINP